jgi:hypothetical protein
MKIRIPLGPRSVAVVGAPGVVDLTSVDMTSSLRAATSLFEDRIGFAVDADLFPTLSKTRAEGHDRPE